MVIKTIMDVKTNEEIREEVKKVNYRTKRKYGTISYSITILVCLALYALFSLNVFRVENIYRSLLQRIFLAGAGVGFVFLLTRIAEKLITKRSSGKRASYNLIRLIHLLSILIALFILISFLFEKWYAAALSLGLVSLILGFALQTPISSLIGWLYIIIRHPYRIGDRIQIADFTGDVVEINYLDTTLWEFHGSFLSNDVPSGRLIRFPNTLVLQREVYNYSWKKFPFIWNEIPFYISYDSDLSLAETIIKEAAKNELGEKITEAVSEFKELVKATPVDEMNMEEYPFVIIKTNVNGWIEVSLTYLVDPKKVAETRSKLINSIVQKLLTKDKIKLPGISK